MSNNTGFAVGGLIGAGIQYGHESGQDKKKLELLIGSIGAPSCSEQVVDSFVEKLGEKGITLHNKTEKKSLIKKVELQFDSCGIKIVNTQSKNTAAYVRFTLSIYGQKKKPVMEQHIIITGKKSFPFEILEARGSLANEEFVAVLKKAGKRAANKVIYL